MTRLTDLNTKTGDWPPIARWACAAAWVMVYVGCQPPRDSVPISQTLPTATPASAAMAWQRDVAPLLTTSAEARSAHEDDWFRDVTATCGLQFAHSSGRTAGLYTMVETFGSGVALLDVDQDGDLDVFCVGGGNISETSVITGRSCRLFRNVGDATFEDITESAGLTNAPDYSFGVAAADDDNDGDIDLFVTCYGRSTLYRNDGQGHFVDATVEAKIDVQGWQTACCFADVNRDGAADLFVTGYLQWQPSLEESCKAPQTGLRDVCMPGSFPPAADSLWINQRDGTFVPAASDCGIRRDGKGLGVVADDFDRDGNVDLYVANDVQRNHLYWGDGTGRFVEQAVLSGVAGNEFGAAEGSMGVDAMDLNGDGLPELFVTNYELEDNSLYHNEGHRAFTHRTVRYVLGGACRPHVGFGTLFADFDGDGWQDLVVVNGHVTYRNRTSTYLQPAKLYRNRDGQRFEEISSAAGSWFSVPHAGRGLASGDLNNDGAIDLVITEQDGQVSVLLNQRPRTDWIGLDLRGSQGATPPVGTTVRQLAAESTRPLSVRAGGSYLSSSDPRLILAISNGAHRVTVRVNWPTAAEDFVDLLAGSYHRLQQGHGVPVATDAGAKP